MIPFEMSIRVTNSNEGYTVTVILESKDFTKPVIVSQKKVYADLNDISDLRQEAIDEYYRKASKL
jgi:hypothetical protein